MNNKLDNDILTMLRNTVRCEEFCLLVRCIQKESQLFLSFILYGEGLLSYLNSCPLINDPHKDKAKVK